MFDRSVMRSRGGADLKKQSPLSCGRRRFGISRRTVSCRTNGQGQFKSSETEIEESVLQEHSCKKQRPDQSSVDVRLSLKSMSEGPRLPQEEDLRKNAENHR